MILKIGNLPEECCDPGNGTYHCISRSVGKRSFNPAGQLDITEKLLTQNHSVLALWGKSSKSIESPNRC